MTLNKSTALERSSPLSAARIHVNGNRIQVENADGSRVLIRNALGQTLYISQGNANVSVSCGLYLVSVGNATHSIQVK